MCQTGILERDRDGPGNGGRGLWIMKTMVSIIKLRPINGSRLTAAATTILAAQLGAPVSTTHGSRRHHRVGASKRVSAVRGVAWNMIVAWVLTIPISAPVAAGVYSVSANSL